MLSRRLYKLVLVGALRDEPGPTFVRSSMLILNKSYTTKIESNGYSVVKLKHANIQGGKRMLTNNTSIVPPRNTYRVYEIHYGLERIIKRDSMYFRRSLLITVFFPTSYKKPAPHWNTIRIQGIRKRKTNGINS